MEEDGHNATATLPTPPTITAVNIKILPFWPADPAVWFAQVEAQFTTRGITSQKTRFDHIVAFLSPEVAMEVRDLILRPPAERPYDTLKEQLVKRTAESEQRKLQQLLTAEELGDRKPSQLLRHMQQLLGDRASVTDIAVLREFFLQRMPSNVRVVLVSTPETTDLQQLAELADKVVDVAVPSVSAIQTPQLTTEVQQLRTEMTRLQQLVQSLADNRSRSKSRRSPTPSRTPRSSNSSQPSAPTNSDDSSLCWYHQKFGDDSRRCRSPCSKASNFQATH